MHARMKGNKIRVSWTRPRGYTRYSLFIAKITPIILDDDDDDDDYDIYLLGESAAVDSIINH